MLTLTGTYDHYLYPNQPQKITIKEDRITFWQYEKDYRNFGENWEKPYKRISLTAPITQPLEWQYYERIDTSGKKNYNFYSYIVGKGWYNYERESRLCQVSFQTWDFVTVWYQVNYVPKKEDMVIISQGIDLDPANVTKFINWANEYGMRG